MFAWERASSHRRRRRDIVTVRRGRGTQIMSRCREETWPARPRQSEFAGQAGLPDQAVEPYSFECSRNLRADLTCQSAAQARVALPVSLYLEAYYSDTVGHLKRAVHGEGGEAQVNQHLMTEEVVVPDIEVEFYSLPDVDPNPLLPCGR